MVGFINLLGFSINIKKILRRIADVGVQTAPALPLTSDAAIQTSQLTSDAVVQTAHLTGNVLHNIHSDQGMQVILSSKRDFGAITDSLQQNLSAIDSMAEFPIIDFPVMEPTVILSHPPFYETINAEVQTDALDFNLLPSLLRTRFSDLTTTEMEYLFPELRVEEWMQNVEIDSISSGSSDINSPSVSDILSPVTDTHY